MNWEDFLEDTLNFVMNTFGDKTSEYVKGLVSIVIPIVENVSKIDLNDDNIIHHYKEEIWRIAQDEGVQFGDDITEALIVATNGNLLRNLLATAQIANIIAKAVSFPIPDWVINWLIEYAIGMLKNGLQVLDENIHEYMTETANEYQSAIGKFLLDLETSTGHDMSFEYSWGSDTFFIITDTNKYGGSVADLLGYTKAGEYNRLLQIFTDRIKG